MAVFSGRHLVPGILGQNKKFKYFYFGCFQLARNTCTFLSVQIRVTNSEFNRLTKEKLNSTEGHLKTTDKKYRNLKWLIWFLNGCSDHLVTAHSWLDMQHLQYINLYAVGGRIIMLNVGGAWGAFIFFYLLDNVYANLDGHMTNFWSFCPRRWANSCTWMYRMLQKCTNFMQLLTLAC